LVNIEVSVEGFTSYQHGKDPAFFLGKIRRQQIQSKAKPKSNREERSHTYLRKAQKDPLVSIVRIQKIGRYFLSSQPSVRSSDKSKEEKEKTEKKMKG